MAISALSYTAKLSTRPEKFLGEVATWDHAEAALKQALERRETAVHAQRGRRRLLRAEDRLRHHRRASDASGSARTIQLDYMMPQRFDLKYIGADNSEHRPVVIHRAIFGSIERFIAIMLEHFAGAFPLWLAPVQAVVLPIADRHVEYAERVRAALAAAGLRVEVDARQEKINYKIREAQLQKVPYMLVDWRSRSGGGAPWRSAAAAKGDLGARPRRRVPGRRACRGGGKNVYPSRFRSRRVLSGNRRGSLHGECPGTGFGRNSSEGVRYRFRS